MFIAYLHICLLLTHTKKRNLPTAVPFFVFQTFYLLGYFIFREANSAHRSSSVLLL